MEIRGVKFRVGTDWRVGGLYLPAGRERGAAVLMLHGFPGVLQNEDIAAELCRRGMSVFLPHFRGCWGSAGEFSLHGICEDARTALRLLSRYHQVDPADVGLLGYSLGGWVALKLASETRVAAAAILAPAIPRGGVPGDEDYLRRNARMANIPRPEALWREYLAAARADHPDEYVRRIAPTPLLFVQGFKDELVPAHSTSRLWSRARQPKEYVGLPEEGHDFQADRPAVIAAVCGWLEARLAEAASRIAAKTPTAEARNIPVSGDGRPVPEDFPEFVDIGDGD